MSMLKAVQSPLKFMNINSTGLSLASQTCDFNPLEIKLVTTDVGNKIVGELIARDFTFHSQDIHWRAIRISLA